MRIKLIVFTLLIFGACANTCGNNCPQDNCQACPCGSTNQTVDVGQYCRAYPRWNYSCCYCMASRMSAGNAHYTLQRRDLLIGVMPSSAQECGVTDLSLLCDWQKNAQCAGVNYEKEGWSGPAYSWANAAKACGCPYLWQKDEYNLKSE